MSRCALKPLAAVLISLALSACGGGGGDSAPAPSPAPQPTPLPPADTAEGFWSGTSSSGFSILGAGTSGCTFSGSIAPRPGGTAVYGVSVTFNGGVCLLGTQTIDGIGAVGNTTQGPVLYAAALNGTRSAGLVLISGR